jgi:hypothetical protein
MFSHKSFIGLAPGPHFSQGDKNRVEFSTLQVAVPERSTPLLGRLLALLTKMLEKPARDKHFYLFRTYINYGRKKFS